AGDRTGQPNSAARAHVGVSGGCAQQGATLGVLVLDTRQRIRTAEGTSRDLPQKTLSAPFPLQPSLSNLQQLARLPVPPGREAVRAGDDAGQRDEVAPPERRPRAVEVLRHRAVVLLRVQGAVLADAVLQQQVERRARVVPLLAVALDVCGAPVQVPLLQRAF